MIGFFLHSIPIQYPFAFINPNRLQSTPSLSVSLQANNGPSPAIISHHLQLDSLRRMASSDSHSNHNLFHLQSSFNSCYLRPSVLFYCRFQVLLLALVTIKKSGHEHVYSNVHNPLLFAQSAAVLEILHGLIGLVRSPISATLPQISSRLYLLWGILYSFPEVQTHPLISFLVISFGITEVVRYSFFGTKEAFGSAPYWLLWLRYSTFFVMYPTGITSEVGLIYNALPYMKESGLYTVRMANKWNFSFDYFYAAIVVLAIYVPGVPHLFGYMLRQRKKTLSYQKEE